MRVLGVDYGLKRVGLALSDPTGTLASPLTTLRRRAGRRPPLKAMSEVVESHGVERIVFGLPLPLTGGENEWCAEVRRVGASLAERTGLPVTFVDERFTSVQAERAVRSSGLRRADRENKARVDAGAATLILQSWLDGAPAL
ncbi:MAG: Holliday junction resolvase RuvX [Gemmatimonadota bacterium]